MLTTDPDTEPSTVDEAVPEATLATRRPVAPQVRRRTRVRRRLHRTAVAKRGPLVKVHRWVSLLLVAWIVVESVSGAALVFAPEIGQLWNREAFATTKGDVGVDAALAAAKEARPDDLVTYASLPGAEHSGGVYHVFVTDRAGGTHWVLVDPGSGKVTARNYQEPGAMRFLERLHFNLNSTSVFGFAPLSVLGWMATAWLLVLLTGFYLWYWPGVKRWANALRVRRGKRFQFHLDLHKAIGLVAFVPLVLVAATGINFGFPDQVRAVWNAVTFGTVHEEDVTTPLSTPVPGATPLTAQQAAEVVAGLDRSVHVDAVDSPGGSPVGVWTVYAEVDRAALGMAGGQRSVAFAVDQYSGGIVSIDDDADLGFSTRVYEGWTAPIHFGTFAGTPSLVASVFVGLAPAVLGTTGVVMWFVRRNKRRDAAARRAARDGAGAAPPGEPDGGDGPLDAPPAPADEATAAGPDAAPDVEPEPTGAALAPDPEPGPRADPTDPLPTDPTGASR